MANFWVALHVYVCVFFEGMYVGLNWKLGDWKSVGEYFSSTFLGAGCCWFYGSLC